jgi:hypothetical protein
MDNCRTGIRVGRPDQSEEFARVVAMLSCSVCVAGAIEGPLREDFRSRKEQRL